jgi:hypothetical protein
MHGNQHCSTVFGDSKSWEEGLKTRALKLKVTTGIEPVADLGPVISKQPKECTCSLDESGASWMWNKGQSECLLRMCVLTNILKLVQIGW